MRTQQHNPNHGPLSKKTGPEYQPLEQIILESAGVDCTVKVTGGTISIRAKSYPDFILAKNSIKDLANGRAIIHAGFQSALSLNRKASDPKGADSTEKQDLDLPGGVLKQ